MGRELESRISDGETYTVSTFTNRRVRQAHHREGGKPEGDVDLDEDWIGIDAEHRRRTKARKHASEACKGRDAWKRLAFRCAAGARSDFCNAAEATTLQIAMMP
jgi:hypothetical protein